MDFIPDKCVGDCVEDAEGWEILSEPGFMGFQGYSGREMNVAMSTHVAFLAERKDIDVRCLPTWVEAVTLLYSVQERYLGRNATWVAKRNVGKNRNAKRL